MPGEVMEILSLGAGVQSSTMALMADRGLLGKRPDCAIFADTQREPQSVYDWLDWLEPQLSFPVYRVSKGDLGADSLVVRRSKKSGRLYMKGLIPAFIKKPEGKPVLLGRKCTADYKVLPIQRKVRELTGVKCQGKGIIAARMWIGISTDEASRMKPSRVDYIENCWPLLDADMSREDCKDWMAKQRFPLPPRSACYFCPFHSDEEWSRIEQEEPDAFEGSVKYEREMQDAADRQEALVGIPYLHSTLIPLDQVNFGWKPGPAQLDMFGNECEGMCGV